MLIKAGARVNIANSQGNRSIHTLTVPINLERRKVLLDLLVKHGADVNAQNDDGQTMLHMSIIMAKRIGCFFCKNISAISKFLYQK